MDVITTHLHADFDALASMVAAKKLYPRAVMAFSGSQERNLRVFFSQSLQFIYDFQRPKNIPLDQIRRLILVDTRQPGRIGPFQKCLHNPDIEIHIFDHHPNAPGDLIGQFEVVRPVGSTSTIFIEMFQERNITITKDEATLLALAIYEDTGSFSFETTTPEDLRAMAWLLEKGANLQAVTQFLSQELSSHEVSLLHELIKSAHSYAIRGVDIVVTTLSIKDYVDEFSLLVRRIMTMENLNVLFSIARMGNRIYFIGRSRIPEVNVGKIAADFGGGGHASAASASIKNMTLIEAEEKLVQLLHKHVRPISIASEIMSSPVISVVPDISIEDANNTLTRYDLTVLPVIVEKKIKGTISRRVAEKAIHHGLGKLPVSDYMTTDFATLHSAATLSEIQELIVGRRQRFIPVVDDDIVSGVITRTDLLSLLVNDPALTPKNLLNPHIRPSSDKFRNLQNLIVSTISSEMIQMLRTIGEVALKNGYTAYVVGGFVRDLLLHIPNYDIDIVIEGDGIDFAKKLGGEFGAKVRTHEKFSTAVVIFPGGEKIDVATARLEYYEYPAAMPIVEFSSIKLDLYRRDFTINAMAIHLNPGQFGTLVDFFNCQNDLKDRQIRILHNLSFVEDPTRILRAIRFEKRMSFQIGKHTEKLIKNTVKLNVFERFAGQRFFVELKIILSEENPLLAIHRMAEFDLLKFFAPELKLDQRLKQILEETNEAVSWYKLLYVDEKFHYWMVFVLALTARISVKRVYSFCLNFEVPEKYKQALLNLKLSAVQALRTLDKQKDRCPSMIYKTLDGIAIEGLLFLMGLSKKKVVKKAVSLYVTQLRLTRTEIHGNDLLTLGYTPGPVFRTILDKVLEAKLDGIVTTKEEEIDFVGRHFPKQGGD